MKIATTTVEKLLDFSRQRDWTQFHTPENLAKAISIEAGELLECFQWNNEFEPAELKDELADVVSYCLLLANAVNIDIDKAISDKITVNESRYPVDKSAGVSTKYDKL